MGIDTSAETPPVCRVVRATASYEGKQGPAYAQGISAETTGATGLWMGRVEIGPGSRTKAHYHEHHETAIYMMDGEVDMWSGPFLERHEIARAGDYVYIHAGVPHVAANRSATHPVHAIIARTDPNEQESVFLTPELEQHLPFTGE